MSHKHPTIYYKMNAIKYYIENGENLDKTCKYYSCNKVSLSKWVNQYKIYAIKYYMKNENVKKTCKYYYCNKELLLKWVKQYKLIENIN